MATLSINCWLSFLKKKDLQKFKKKIPEQVEASLCSTMFCSLSTLFFADSRAGGLHVQISAPRKIRVITQATWKEMILLMNCPKHYMPLQS